jgi:hypothetical protein
MTERAPDKTLVVGEPGSGMSPVSILICIDWHQNFATHSKAKRRWFEDMLTTSLRKATSQPLVVSCPTVFQGNAETNYHPFIIVECVQKVVQVGDVNVRMQASRLRLVSVFCTFSHRFLFTISTTQLWDIAGIGITFEPIVQ